MPTSDSFDDWRQGLATETRTATEGRESPAVIEVPGITILAHPDPRRVGEQALWPSLSPLASPTWTSAELSRLTPELTPPSGGEGRPLADPHLSRRPLVLRPSAAGGLTLDVSDTRTRVEIDGSAVTAPPELSAAALARGVVMLLGGRVALLLHLVRPLTERPPDFGLVGESDALVSLRWEIERLAGLALPVLLRGESGTGKELVARALERHGPTAGGPFLSLNMGAIPASLAAAELFGATRGAYSGAERARAGYFQRADGGTLFLDEIGETPVEIQALLLRALESGEIQPVGSERPRRVDVRVIAATDADLEAAIDGGRFRAPLLHRLSSYEIRLPSLRQRRADIGRLFYHFLAIELQASGETRPLVSLGASGKPWVSAALVAALARYDWPGNVRQLRNVVRHLVVAHRGREQLRMTEYLATLLGLTRPFPTVCLEQEKDQESPDLVSSSAPRPQRRARRQAYRDPSEIDDEELLNQLRRHSFELKPTAEALGISRASLYLLIDRCPGVRKAADLKRTEIEACAYRHDGSIVAMAAELEVSRQGLKRRMKDLGLR